MRIVKGQNSGRYQAFGYVTSLSLIGNMGGEAGFPRSCLVQAFIPSQFSLTTRTVSKTSSSLGGWLDEHLKDLSSRRLWHRHVFAPCAVTNTELSLPTKEKETSKEKSLPSADLMHICSR